MTRPVIPGSSPQKATQEAAVIRARTETQLKMREKIIPAEANRFKYERAGVKSAMPFIASFNGIDNQQSHNTISLLFLPVYLEKN
jgi:hypothetical protein